MINIRLQSPTTSLDNFYLNVDLNFNKGDFIGLYGPSGVGKTSILRIIAGLKNIENGHVTFLKQSWLDSQNKINLPPQQRSIGYVFQDYALFPNMSVEENLNFALPQSNDTTIVSELIELMSLGNIKNRRPNTLSGGQQQRVALARALVQKPQLLLLDEPLSALDTAMRNRLQDYILKAHKEFNLTTILVSHDIGEMVKMCNKVVVLKKGEVDKFGTPNEVFINHKLSGKFQFTGEVLQIEKADVVYVLTILIGNNIVKTIIEKAEAKELTIGDKILVASKAFNPIVKKLT